MTEVVFWTLLSLLNWDQTGDDIAVIEPVVSALSEKSTEEIFAFEELLAQKLYALDTLVHAKEIGEDAYKVGQHFSVDGFLYARCVVVANGSEVYSHILKNPKDFPKDMEFEALLSIGPIAYERKTGKEYGHVTKTSYETFANESAWQ